MHACQSVTFAARRWPFGCGPSALVHLIARGMGASKIIGVEPDPHHAELARRLGCDAVFSPSKPPEDARTARTALIEQVRTLTDGIGVDVAMETGFNSSLNNAIKMTRRGRRSALRCEEWRRHH